MEPAERKSQDLTPEERRAQLRAFADRMLIALSQTDDPKTGEDIEKGIRRALLIERLYARCDAAQAKATKNAMAEIDRQVAVKTKPAASSPSAAETQFEIAARALAMKAKTLHRATKCDPQSLRQIMSRHIAPQAAKPDRDTS